MIPTDLRIVAVIQLLGGLSALGNVLFRLGQGSLWLDFGVLGIPAYFGLMRLDPTWRRWTIGIAWLGCVAAAVLPFMGFAAGGSASVALFGIQLGNISWPWVWLAMALMFLLCFWQQRVLTRPEVSALFDRGGVFDRAVLPIKP